MRIYKETDTLNHARVQELIAECQSLKKASENNFEDIIRHSNRNNVHYQLALTALRENKQSR
ncbi:MAG: hypothetical protein A2X41_02425 [Candidatus Margulisbacteria bacterium GWE2_39_32]|nr:MAG: hypothetical protein A2X41_02425 [Candidatus Margulisbacteria bacterium GWE2_39_32]